MKVPTGLYSDFAFKLLSNALKHEEKLSAKAATSNAIILRNPDGEVVLDTDPVTDACFKLKPWKYVARVPCAAGLWVKKSKDECLSILSGIVFRYIGYKPFIARHESFCFVIDYLKSGLSHKVAFARKEVKAHVIGIPRDPVATELEQLKLDEIMELNDKYSKFISPYYMYSSVDDAVDKLAKLQISYDKEFKQIEDKYNLKT